MTTLSDWGVPIVVISGVFGLVALVSSVVLILDRRANAPRGGDGTPGDAKVMAEYRKAVETAMALNARGAISDRSLHHLVDRLTEAAVALGGVRDEGDDGEAPAKPDAGDLAEIAGDSEVAR